MADLSEDEENPLVIGLFKLSSEDLFSINASIHNKAHFCAVASCCPYGVLVS